MTAVTLINPESQERTSPVPQIGSLGGRLCISIVEPSKFPDIQEIALEWERIAEARARSEGNPDLKKRLEDCKIISTSIHTEEDLYDNIVMVCASRLGIDQK